MQPIFKFNIRCLAGISYLDLHERSSMLVLEDTSLGFYRLHLQAWEEMVPDETL